MCCLNCEIEIEGGEFCPACRWLTRRGPISPRGTSDERLINRRWQMRFARGEIDPEGSDDGALM